MQGLAFRGHEEARENLSASCRVIRDNYLELLALILRWVPLTMEKASEVYFHSKQNDAMDNENIILSLSDKNYWGC